MSQPRKPRVFVIQDNPRNSYAPASKIGEVINTVHPFADFDPHTIITVLRESLKDFDGNTDYLLLSGGPLAVGLAHAIITEKFKQFRVLRWSGQKLDYDIIYIDLEKNYAEKAIAA